MHRRLRSLEMRQECSEHLSVLSRPARSFMSVPPFNTYLGVRIERKEEGEAIALLDLAAHDRSGGSE